MNDIYLIIDEDSRRTLGYARTDYSSSASYETTVRTTEDELASIFEDAKAAGETPDGADATIDAAIDDPLAFRDYLILVDGSIEFDSDFVRETPGETQA